MMPTLNLCCCGSIAIISIPRLILTLRLAYGTRITIFLSQGAQKFMSPMLFQALTHEPVYTDVFQIAEYLAQTSTPTLIAPASANAVASMARGHACHMAACVALQATGTLFVAPAMNERMWNNPSTQRSVEILKADGAIVTPPESGREIADLSISSTSLASIDSIIKVLLVHLPLR